jgi:hypothetical protein
MKILERISIAVMIILCSAILGYLHVSRLERKKEVEVLQAQIGVLNTTTLEAIHRVYETTGARLDALESISLESSKNAAMERKELEKRVNGELRRTNSAVLGSLERIDRVYSDVLEEQRKKTVEDLYDDDILAQNLNSGIERYRMGNYVEAYGILKEVSARLPENADAQFYFLAADFNLNRQDSSKYDNILSHIQRLALLGYKNEEMEIISSFIETEQLARTNGEIAQ